MRYLPFFLALFFLSNSAFADSINSGAKPFSIGIATYATTIAYDNSLYDDDEFSGMALSFAYAFNDSLAFRGTFFSLEHDDFSDLESSGYDLLLHFGTGLATTGLKAYIGGGLFKDQWELYSLEETFNGFQLSGGVGYNWEPVSLDFVLGIRDASDYENFVNGPFTNTSAAAVSASLILSVRF